MADLIIALASAGLAFIFFPTVWHNLRNGCCEIPLYTAIPRTFFLVLLASAYFTVGFYVAGSVLVFDVLCWLILIAQRLRYRR